jgi:hypothetical protein
VHYTTCCNTQSSAPEDGQNNCPKHVELTGIINKPLLLHLVGCIYYLYQRCTVKQISDNEIYLLIKYIRSVLWRVVKRLSYIEDIRCLKVNVEAHTVHMRYTVQTTSNTWPCSFPPYTQTHNAKLSLFSRSRGTKNSHVKMEYQLLCTQNGFSAHCPSLKRKLRRSSCSLCFCRSTFFKFLNTRPLFREHFNSCKPTETTRIHYCLISYNG